MAQESKLQSKILKDLRNIDNCFVFKIQKASDNGVPDIFFSHINTGGIFIEVKAPNKTPSKLQRKKISDINQSGCKAFYCDSWELWLAIRQSINIPKK